MSAPAPLNMWTNMLAFGALLPVQQNYELRMENDGDGNILYMGMALAPNSATDEPVWNLYKFEYDGGFLVWTRKPDDDTGFKYTWDDRATYFS